VFGLMWARVTIIIVPSTQKVNQNFNFSVKENAVANSNNIVSGRVTTIEVSGNGSFPASGAKPTTTKANIEATTTQITLVNDNNQDQNLVDTTRLTSADNPGQVLFRLKKSVTVPAGKQVVAEVVAEKGINVDNLNIDHFIIPGLNKPLQAKIYGQNLQVSSPNGQPPATVTSDDLKQAQAGLKDKLYQQALGELNKNLSAQQSLWPKLVSVKVESVNYSAKAGDVVSQFSADMKLQATFVVFDESQVVDLVSNNLKNSIPTDQKLVNIDPKSFAYEVKNIDLNNHAADVNVTFAANSIISGTANSFDKGKLTGLTEEQVKSYFSQFSGIGSIQVQFHPSWLRKTPALKDKIDIQIANSQ